MYENVFAFVDNKGNVFVCVSKEKYRSEARAVIASHNPPSGGWRYIGRRQVKSKLDITAFPL